MATIQQALAAMINWWLSPHPWYTPLLFGACLFAFNIALTTVQALAEYAYIRYWVRRRAPRPTGAAAEQD